jgi:hypothetical protein
MSSGPSGREREKTILTVVRDDTLVLAAIG